jgi:hypothetical protein
MLFMVWMLCLIGSAIAISLLSLMIEVGRMLRRHRASRVLLRGPLSHERPA